MVSRLHRSLLRDLWHMRGQVFAAALVIACGLAAFVTMRSAYHSLLSARAGYYTQYRFADVFAHLKRAPGFIADEVSAIPGVTAVEARIVQDVTLSVPGLAEPATGRLISIPDGLSPALNGLSMQVGRYPAAGRVDEVVASETFARANAAIEAAGGTVIATAEICDRLESVVDVGVPNFALADYRAPENYPAANCPLCQAGLEVTAF